MKSTTAPHLVPEIHLCRGVYKPTCTDLPSVEVFCQAVVINNAAYVWIDGIDGTNPLLLPVQALKEFRKMGTLREYLEEEKHTELGEDFDRLIDLCMERKDSATVLIRACEIMHAEGLPADQAVVTAHQWGTLLNELDQAERVAYQLLTSGTSTRMPSQPASTVH